MNTKESTTYRNNICVTLFQNDSIVAFLLFLIISLFQCSEYPPCSVYNRFYQRESPSSWSFSSLSSCFSPTAPKRKIPSLLCSASFFSKLSPLSYSPSQWKYLPVTSITRHLLFSCPPFQAVVPLPPSFFFSLATQERLIHQQPSLVANLVLAAPCSPFLSWWRSQERRKKRKKIIIKKQKTCLPFEEVCTCIDRIFSPT